MRAELMVLGKPVNLSQRSDRQMLVVWVYVVLALAMAGAWWLDEWQASGYYVVFLAILFNQVLLGGYGRRGLIRPFSGKPPRDTMPPPAYLLLGIHLRLSEPADGEWRSDEREMALRDRAHFQAYQWISAVLAVLWLLARFANARHGELLLRFHELILNVLYGTTITGAMLMLTLPQAILLWNEPDMREFSLED